MLQERVQICYCLIPLACFQVAIVRCPDCSTHTRRDTVNTPCTLLRDTFAGRTRDQSKNRAPSVKESRPSVKESRPSVKESRPLSQIIAPLLQNRCNDLATGESVAGAALGLCLGGSDVHRKSIGSNNGSNNGSNIGSNTGSVLAF